MPAQTKAERVERIQGGLNVKTDCFEYDTEKKDCTVMTELLCLRKKCSFYKPREAAEGSSQENHMRLKRGDSGGQENTKSISSISEGNTED